MSLNPIPNPAIPTDAQPPTPTPPLVVQPRLTSEDIPGVSPQSEAPAPKRDVLNRRTSIDTAVIRPTEGGMRVLLVEDNEVCYPWAWLMSTTQLSSYTYEQWRRDRAYKASGNLSCASRLRCLILVALTIRSFTNDRRSTWNYSWLTCANWSLTTRLLSMDWKLSTLIRKLRVLSTLFLWVSLLHLLHLSFPMESQIFYAQLDFGSFHLCAKSSVRTSANTSPRHLNANHGRYPIHPSHPALRTRKRTHTRRSHRTDGSRESNDPAGGICQWSRSIPDETNCDEESQEHVRGSWKGQKGGIWRCCRVKNEEHEPEAMLAIESMYFR